MKAALQNVSAAGSDLADAAQSSFGPQVAALRQSVTALRSTVDGLQDQSDLASKFGALSASLSAVQQAAAPIVDSARGGCPAFPSASLPGSAPSAAPTT